MKKLLAFLLCFVLVFAGLPVIAAQKTQAADIWQLIGSGSHTITVSNRVTAHENTFNVPNRGAVLFRSTRLIDYQGIEQSMKVEIFRSSDYSRSNAVWSCYTDRLDATTQYIQAFIGLDAGSYVIKFSPSMFSSSFPSGNQYTFSYDFNYYLPENNIEIENNNLRTNATAITFGAPMRAFADRSGEDFFSFYASKATLAKITIANYTKLSEAGALLRIYNGASSTADYLSKSEGTASGDSYSFYVLLEAGTNYLNVTQPTSKTVVEYVVTVAQQSKLDTPVVYSRKKSGTTAELYWKVVGGADGYQIQRKINKGAWKTELTNYGAERNGLKQTGSNFKYTYQFRIRAFKKIGSTTIYSNWSAIASFNPTPTNIKLSATNYTYNGKAKKPSVTVKNALGVTLKNGTDYTVTYPSGRKKIGKYKVVITFKGDYSGKKTVYFNINPKSTSVSSVSAKSKALKVKIKKQTSQTSGYQIQYSTSKKFSNAKTITIKSNKTTSATIKKLKGNKTYYVRVRTYKKVSGTTCYSSWSSAKSKKTKR